MSYKSSTSQHGRLIDQQARWLRSIPDWLNKDGWTAGPTMRQITASFLQRHQVSPKTICDDCVNLFPKHCRKIHYQKWRKMLKHKKIVSRSCCIWKAPPTGIIQWSAPRPPSCPTLHDSSPLISTASSNCLLQSLQPSEKKRQNASGCCEDCTTLLFA